jgi:hypothetical protein
VNDFDPTATYASTHNNYGIARPAGAKLPYPSGVHRSDAGGRGFTNRVTLDMHGEEEWELDEKVGNGGTRSSFLFDPTPDLPCGSGSGSGSGSRSGSGADSIDEDKDMGRGNKRGSIDKLALDLGRQREKTDLDGMGLQEIGQSPTESMTRMGRSEVDLGLGDAIGSQVHLNVLTKGNGGA